MRQIIFALMFAVALSVTSTCAAKDVWVERDSDGFNIYAMDDTIRSVYSEDGKFVSVTVKSVGNGQASKIVTWYFTRRSDSDKWYYSTRRIGGENALTRNKIFEFCMKEIGWSYTTDGKYYY